VIVGNLFSTKVVAARSFATRIVQFQRRSSQGQWVTLKRLQLNATSSAIFRATLPKGTSSVEDVPRVVDFRWRSGGGLSQACVTVTSWVG
jgi:hypothetical protein